MEAKKEITRATGVMGVATGLSRISGLVRDILVARLFGAGFGTDAFFMAFTIPNLLRRFFAEGSLTAAFVPTFADQLHREGRGEALRVARICWTLLFLIMAVVTVVGVLSSPWIVRMIGYGFTSVEGKLALTDHLNRIMFPYIFFVSLLALVTGIMNVFGHYFVPAVSPIFLNLAMIMAAIFFAPFFAVPIEALAYGVLLGGLIQLLIQFPTLKRLEIRLGWDFCFNHPAVRQVMRLMLPGLAGVAIYQINIITTRLLASFLPEGSVSYLYYGQRLFEFPQGIFIVSLAQALLPPMSRQVAAGDHEGVKESLRFALALILIVTLPAAVGLVLCAEPVFSLFFMNGAFGIEQVNQSALVLMAYAPGLVFVGISRIFVPTFYAMKNTRTPVVISFYTFLVNALLGLVLMWPLGHVGLAAALTISSVFNALFLVWMLRRQIGRLGLRSVFVTAIKLIPATALMALVVYAILRLAPWEEAGGTAWKGLTLSAGVASGVMVYGLACLLFRVREVFSLYQMIQRRFGRSGS